LNFPANPFWACFSVKLPIFGLFLKCTCLFLRNNLASLLNSQTELQRKRQQRKRRTEGRITVVLQIGVMPQREYDHERSQQVGE